MPFRPMPLLNFDKGLFKAREPFLAPTNAFTEMLNCHTLRGQVLKRKGYSVHGQLAIETTDTNTQNLATITGTLSSLPLERPGWLTDSANTLSVNFDDTSESADGYYDPGYVKSNGTSVAAVIVVTARVSTTLTSGLTEYTGTHDAVYNARGAAVTVTDAGTGQTATVDFSSLAGGSSFAEASTVSWTGSDINEAADNFFYLPVDVTEGLLGVATYSFTFKLVTTGVVTFSYDKVLGWVTISTGAYQVTNPSSPTAWLNPTTITYNYLPERPVMGIYDFFTLDGSEYLIACDTKRLWLWDATEGRYKDFDPGVADPWSQATDENLFQFQGYDDVVYINNGADVPKTYDPDALSGSRVVSTGTDVDGGSGDVVEAASRFLRHKNRGIYFRPTESSVIQQQRVRFTPVNDIEYAAASATNDYSDLYADAPTEDVIISADFVGDDIVVIFKRSVWRLRYIGDPYSPYEWERVPSMDGGPARMGLVQLGHSILFRGTQSMQICDGVSAQPFDFDIPDFLLDWEQNDALYTSGIFVPQERQAIFNYADIGETLPDSILAVQLDELRRVQSFSQYKTSVGFHCFGSYRQGSSPVWDDFGEIWDYYDLPWDAYGSSIGAPIVLAGDYTGTVYKFADGYNDNGSDIEMSLKTIRLNPYPYQRVHLGYIDIQVDAVKDGSLTVYTIPDYQSTPNTVTTIDLTPTETGSEKVVRRISVNKIANFHTIQVWNKDQRPLAIDALTPWFKPAGPMREVS